MPRHRRRRSKPSARELALLAYLEHVMQDPVAARLALRVVGMHAGLVQWMHDAEQSMLTPAPQRRHPFDDRDTNRGAHISGTRDPDTWMIDVVDRWMLLGGDPEHLDPVRHRLTHRLGELAGWYQELTGPLDLTTDDDVAAWEPLAVRLGDLIGDQTAANAVATSLLSHRHLAAAGWEAERKRARERWRRLAVTYLKVLGAVDDQPTKGRRDHKGRVVVESVDETGERRIG